MNVRIIMGIIINRIIIKILELIEYLSFIEPTGQLILLSTNGKNGTKIAKNKHHTNDIVVANIND